MKLEQYELELLQPYWEKFKAKPAGERVYAVRARNWLSAGWAHYGIDNGYALAIALWYSDATGCAFPPSASPKQIVHEWRRYLKSRQEVICET